MSTERRKLLEELISRSRPISDILNQLSKFGFDSEPVVLIGKSDVVGLLSAYLQGKLNEADIEEWAEAIEVRDDVGYRPEDGGAVKDVVFELANPLLSGPLTMEEAQRLKSSLQRD